MEINRREVLSPGGIELTHIAESKVIFNKNMKLLSIGYGTGEIECYLADKYKIQIIGIDPSSFMISRAQKKAQKLNLNNFVQFKRGSGSHLAFQDEFFDIIFCMGSLIDYFEDGLSEISRVLKPTGKAIIGDVIWLKSEIPLSIRNLWEEDSLVIYSKEQNDQIILSKGFHISLSKKFNEPIWWENYYKDRLYYSQSNKEREYFKKEQEIYWKSRNLLGIGIFIIGFE